MIVVCAFYCYYIILQDEKYIRDLGALEGPKIEVFFQSPKISVEIPAAAVSGWRIIPVNPKLQV